MLCTVYSVKSDILHLNAFARDKGVGFFFFVYAQTCVNICVLQIT